MLPEIKNPGLSSEDAFIKELGNYLEYPLSEYGKNRVRQMLMQYKLNNPVLRIVSKSAAGDIMNEIRGSGLVKGMTFTEIATIVGEYVHLPLHKFIAKKRNRELVYARSLCMFFCKQYTNMSLKSIGEEVYGRDHTTVLSNIRKLKDLMDSTETVREDVRNINNTILSMKIIKQTPDTE